MSLSQKEKVKLSLAIIFLILAGTVYLTGNLKNDKAQYFQNSENPDSLSTELISNWRDLPILHGNLPSNFWDQDLIAAFLFKMSDCSLCLPRMHELVMFVDSLTNYLNIGLFCVGVTKSKLILDRYLAVAPMPCPVLFDLQNKIKYKKTPILIIINQRDNSIVQAIITKSKVSKGFKKETKDLIFMIPSKVTEDN